MSASIEPLFPNLPLDLSAAGTWESNSPPSACLVVLPIHSPPSACCWELVLSVAGSAALYIYVCSEKSQKELMKDGQSQTQRIQLVLLVYLPLLSLCVIIN